MDEKIEQYFYQKTIPEFQQLAIVLHEIILAANPSITASLKWQMPAYDYKGLLIGLGAFKNKVTLFFHRGAEMPDPKGLFVGQERNKTMRSIQFTSFDDITDDIEVYIQNAIKVNESGKVKVKKLTPKPLPEMPYEFEELLNENLRAKSFYNSLNKTRKREYLVWIISAKREETKEARLAKSIQKLSAGQTCWNQYKR